MPSAPAQDATLNEDLTDHEQEYARGVNDTLMWVLGYSDQNPMEE